MRGFSREEQRSKPEVLTPLLTGAPDRAHPKVPDMKGIIRNEKQFSYVLTLPVVVVLLGLLIFPLVFSLFISTQSTAKGMNNMVFVGLKNFKEIFTSPIYANAAVVTTVFVACSVATSTVFGFCVALLLNEIRRGTGVFQTMFILPLAIAPVVTGLTFSMMFNPVFGVINYIFEMLGLPALGWATEIGTALLTIVIVDTWQWTPFMIVIIYAGLQMLPADVYEAADIDGASYVQKLKQLTLPLLKPIIVIALLFRLMDAFRSFDIIYTLTAGGPGHATETVIIKVYQESLRYYRLEIGAAIGILLLVIITVVSKFALKMMPKEGES
jgi:multiple sugar transport system permease protein